MKERWREERKEKRRKDKLKKSNSYLFRTEKKTERKGDKVFPLKFSNFGKIDNLAKLINWIL